MVCEWSLITITPHNVLKCVLHAVRNGNFFEFARKMLHNDFVLSEVRPKEKFWTFQKRHQAIECWSVCSCVCVCVRERERERESERERERERVNICVSEGGGDIHQIRDAQVHMRRRVGERTNGEGDWNGLCWKNWDTHTHAHTDIYIHTHMYKHTNTKTHTHTN